MICVCLHLVMSNTYCVAFCLVLSVFGMYPVYQMMPVSLYYLFLIASSVYPIGYSQLVTPIVSIIVSIYMPLLITMNGCFSRQSPYVYICNVFDVLNITHPGFPF